jgi:DNA repair ATPase RecN
MNVSEINAGTSSSVSTSPWTAMIQLWESIRNCENDMLANPEDTKSDLEQMATLAAQMAKIDSTLPNPVNDPELKQQIQQLQAVIGQMQNSYNPYSQLDRSLEFAPLDGIMQAVFAGLAL